MPHIPKSSRYSIGTRIENKFIDLLESSYTAYFIEKDKKADNISECIFSLDILKFLISLTWESKLISHKQYGEVATKLDETGKMFWGWKKSMDQIKKNPTKSGEKK